MNINDITIVMPTSWLPSHPDTRVIDQTIADVRIHFPDNEIIMQIDGLRSELADKKESYDEYKNRVLWKSLHEWKNVVPVIFDDHSHQSTMMTKTIDMIQTPLMIYIEGDAPLTPDMEIDWDSCISLIERKVAKTIRFHFESAIPKEHSHLMHGQTNGFVKTTQWSQRPHLTTVDYYRDVVLPNVPELTFIEDTFHGYVQDHHWEHSKLWIYHPNDGNIKRSYHIDGREGRRKFTSDDDAWGYIE
jgi:hypothetical protein